MEEGVPLLIPIKLLRDLGARIDLAKNELFLEKFNVKVPLEIMQSGHAVLVEEDEEEGDLEDQLDEEVDRAGGGEVQRWSASGDLELEDEEDDEEGGHHMECAVSPEEKKLIEKLHQNMGHPSTDALARAPRMGKAREEIIKYVKKTFRCDLCDRHRMPKPARPATIPKSYEANQVVGVDVLYLPWTDPKEQVPVLNIVDWGTCYQVLEPVQGMTAEKVWAAFQRGWVRTFGMPRILVADQGKEFIGKFARKAGEHGALLRLIGARAPWQNGRTERQGGAAKGHLREVERSNLSSQ